MFSAKELEAIDKNYFSIIMAHEYDVTLMSKNTKHIWYLHSIELPDREQVIVFHKHHASDPYHSHSKCGTLKKAIRDIRGHDEFQLNGRKPVLKH